LVEKSQFGTGNVNHFQKTSHCLALKMTDENNNIYQNDFSGHTYPVPQQACFKKFSFAVSYARCLLRASSDLGPLIG